MSKEDVDMLEASRSSIDSIFRLLFPLFAGPLFVIAVAANSLVFVVFYKKPIFRKIVSNR